MKKPSLSAVRAKNRQGFTLLELVVVVAVLVILAGILLPKFDVFRQKASSGVAASNMADVSRTIQSYYTQNSVYPDRWDSLMTQNTSTGVSAALWSADASGTDLEQLDPQLLGSVIVGGTPRLTVSGDITPLQARSLALSGITTVLDVADILTVAPNVAPNDRFNTVSTTRTIGNGVNLKLATLNYGVDSYAKEIMNHLYPNQLNSSLPVPPTGKTVVVLGFGSQNTSVGSLVQEVPFYPNTDVSKYYSRYLAVFEVDDQGGRANLLGVLGADGSMLNTQLADYYKH